MKRFFSLFIVMLALTVSASAAKIDNMFTGDNFNFEGGTKGSWFGWSGAPEALAPGYNSEYCLHVQVASTGSAAWSNQIAYDFAEPLTPNTYYLNVMAKGTGSIQLVLQSSSYGDQVYGPEFQLTSDWQEFSATLNVTAATDVQFRFNYGNATEVFLDNIQFGLEKQGLDAGDYYLFNVEAQAWLGGGNSWGTQASINEHPSPFGITPLDGGEGYTIDSYTYNNANDHFLARDAQDTGFYVDAPAATWTIEETEGGVYLKTAAGKYAAYDGTTILAVETEPSSKAVWQLITKEDLVAAMSLATTDMPADATALLPVANFSRNQAIGWESAKVSPWQVSADCTNKNLSGGNNTNNCAESWHSTFDIYQELTDVPNGWYRIDLQGFYRQDGSDNDNLPYFYANDAKSYISLKTGAENSMSDASASFTSGLYQQKPVYVEVKDGNLRIGVKNEANATLWVIWDNFEISYYGDNFYPQPDPAQTTLVDDGSTIQYLYNEDAKGFFLGANDWNTRASVGSKGYQFKVTKNVDGATWTLNDYVETQTTWKAVFADNASSIWVDNLGGANVNKWVINTLSDGKFTISNPSAAAGLLGMVGTEDTRLYLTEDAEAATLWYAVSEADYAQWIVDYAQWSKAYNKWMNSKMQPGDVVAEEEAVLANWTRTFTGAGQDGTFERNTWSVEADESEVRTPFIQSWVWGGAGAQLSAMKIQHAIFEDLPEGSYEVSITARAYNEMAGSTTPSGVKFVANTTEVDLSTGKTFTYNNMAGVWDNFVIPATVGADGVLDFYIDIYEPNLSWLSFKNFKVVYKGEVAPEIAPVVVTSEVGSSYEGIDAAISDEDGALMAQYLGLDANSTVKIYAILPDGTRDTAADGKGGTDGWRNAEGAFTAWGTDGCTYYSQPYAELYDGVWYFGSSMGSYPGVVTSATTFDSQFAFVNEANGKEIVAKFSIKYEVSAADPVPYMLASTGSQVIPVTRELGLGYTAASATYDVAAVCTGLGIEKIADATLYGVDASCGWTSGTDAEWIKNAMATYDGWRDLNGDFCTWGSGNAAVCVKATTDEKDNITVCTYPGQEPAVSAPVYNAYWVLAANSKACLIDVRVTFVAAGTDQATAIESVENTTSAAQVYDLMGRKVNALSRGQIYIINGKKVMMK